MPQFFHLRSGSMASPLLPSSSRAESSNKFSKPKRTVRVFLNRRKCRFIPLCMLTVWSVPGVYWHVQSMSWMSSVASSIQLRVLGRSAFRFNFAGFDFLPFVPAEERLDGRVSHILFCNSGMMGSTTQARIFDCIISSELLSPSIFLSVIYLPSMRRTSQKHTFSVYAFVSRCGRGLSAQRSAGAYWPTARHFGQSHYAVT